MGFMGDLVVEAVARDLFVPNASRDGDARS